MKNPSLTSGLADWVVNAKTGVPRSRVLREKGFSLVVELYESAGILGWLRIHFMHHSFAAVCTIMKV
jgi:hypothetical protein